jgi:hypothetical protein
MTEKPIPYLRITFSGNDGTKEASNMPAPLIVQYPPGISLRIAKMHTLEYVLKQMKRDGSLDGALKALGCK